MGEVEAAYRQQQHDTEAKLAELAKQTEMANLDTMRSNFLMEYFETQLVESEQIRKAVSGHYTATKTKLSQANAALRTMEETVKELENQLEASERRRGELERTLVFKMASGTVEEEKDVTEEVGKKGKRGKGKEKDAGKKGKEKDTGKKGKPAAKPAKGKTAAKGGKKEAKS